jgi:hypothetical protein
MPHLKYHNPNVAMSIVPAEGPSHSHFTFVLDDGKEHEVSVSDLKDDAAILERILAFDPAA